MNAFFLGAYRVAKVIAMVDRLLKTKVMLSFERSMSTDWINFSSKKQE